MPTFHNLKIPSQEPDAIKSVNGYAATEHIQNGSLLFCVA